MDDVSYTTEEIAQLLKVSKLTVYDLIKKGELSAYRVGRQMRIDAADLEVYKHRGREKSEVPSFQNKAQSASTLRGQIVISGQDSSLDVLAKELEQNLENTRPLRSYVGSLDNLMNMYNGEADLVSVHLFDGDTGNYNVPYVRKLFVSKSFLIVKFIERTAGLYVAKGNPKNIQTWTDFATKGIKMVNRESGAGARVLLDEQLRLNGVDRYSVVGYGDEVLSHQDVASMVASGKADVGVGIEHAALAAEVDFLPMVQEQYDLVMLKTPETQPLVAHVKTILSDTDFQNKLKALGYEVSHMGEVLWEQ
ncbi:uncharacterized protein JNUCC1_01406 [Lentibacillus sp. JNUCC-1]|uniref:substrate-binding domain-containing protein n=1 Tax=Lentibacillus sp. JNUCC-1 TaxID=2654513 RepID=UPI0012E7E494|nr:substrate-binding domain-containing protein [Lentibacillus sp. JNUCC-1]MUV37600.1 uncharacterized protein [Lentibacillus sp. JNUCC-1]